MSKRSSKDNTLPQPEHKKMKVDTTKINTIPDDVWTQKLFPFLTGNQLFKNLRLVSTLWNNHVITTRCNIDVNFPPIHSDSKVEKEKKELGEVTEEYSERVEEFIRCGEEGLFKNVTGLTFKSKIHPKFFGKIVNIDWQSLKTLNLSNNLVTGEGVEQLASGNMKGLTSLNLSQNSIGAEGIEHLAKGNMKGLTSLNVLKNEIGEGSKFLLTGNLKGLTTLNYQSLENKAENHYFATTAHFCENTPFTVHTFDTSDDLKEYMFKYYIGYWKHYGGDTLGLESTDDEADEDEEAQNELKEKLYEFPFGKIADMAVDEIGGMVYNECEREAIVATVYGQTLDAVNFAETDESTPFVIVCKRDGYEYRMHQIIGKTSLLNSFKPFVDIEVEKDEELFSRIEEGKDSEKEDCLFAVFKGEMVNLGFVELK